MSPPYVKAGLTLGRNLANDAMVVLALQRDLRALGYLHSIIDGAFGDGTHKAVCALQYDLLNPPKAASDGTPPVTVASYNRGRVTQVTGQVDTGLAACLAAMVADPAFSKLPNSDDPTAANAAVMKAVTEATWTIAPLPFIAAIVRQESGSRHFAVPSGTNTDNFVIVGIDRNDEGHPEKITSRGYGLGQYTLFHHPPQPAEIAAFIVDPVGNARHTFKELRLKFDRFVRGPDSTADDRTAEHPTLAMRMCRYAPADTRYLRDCARCARAVRKVEIAAGNRVYQGAKTLYEMTQYYASATYHAVPDRAEFLCDWPYAVRRYNGGGVNSYHYQTRVLLNLAAQPAMTGG